MVEGHNAIIEIDFVPEYARRVLAMAKNVTTSSLKQYSDTEILNMCLEYACKPYSIRNIKITAYE